MDVRKPKNEGRNIDEWERIFCLEGKNGGG
jgi:hypothetical protein